MFIRLTFHSSLLCILSNMEFWLILTNMEAQLPTYFNFRQVICKVTSQCHPWALLTDPVCSVNRPYLSAVNKAKVIGSIPGGNPWDLGSIDSTVISLKSLKVCNLNDNQHLTCCCLTNMPESNLTCLGAQHFSGPAVLLWEKPPCLGTVGVGRAHSRAPQLHCWTCFFRPGRNSSAVRELVLHFTDVWNSWYISLHPCRRMAMSAVGEIRTSCRQQLEVAEVMSDASKGCEQMLTAPFTFDIKI